jgi:polyisoprenoid-binding protein YceI
MEFIEWTLYAHHSQFMFKVKHLMITTVTGYFKKFTIEAETQSEDFSKFLNIDFEAEVNSISTNNEQRDNHLKSADFFDVVTYPTIKFIATEFNNNELFGNLTIKGITRPIKMNAKFGGIIIDNQSETKAGFSINGVLSRKEFGLTWNALTETGNVVVGDEVKFDAEIQLVKITRETAAIKEEYAVS